jgi:hypothetical protein
MAFLMTPVSRGQVLTRAKELGWPPLSYHGTTFCGEADWRQRGLSNARERRELFDQLDALARERVGDVVRVSRRR